MILKIIFPPYTESSIFVMTLSLFSVIFIDPNIYGTVVTSISAYINEISALYNQGVVLNILKLFSMVITAPVILIAIIFGSIYLPFTSKDLRGLCVTIPLIHLTILTIVNLIYLKESGSIVNAIFFWHSISWLAVTWIKIKKKDIDAIISPDDDKGSDALLLGFMSLLIIFIFIQLLSISWIIAYSTAFFYSSYTGRLMKSFFNKKSRIF